MAEEKSLEKKISEKKSLQTKCFTENYSEEGTAFSFEVTEKLFDVKSPYQHIEVYKTTKHGNLLVIDGCVMLTTRDNFFYHEMLAHPALFTHVRPQKVVIIGGGDCGTLHEVLKHDVVEKVIQIDIDEEVTNAAKKYFPELCVDVGKDARAELLFQDGILWIENEASESVDVIIIDSTDPIGPALGLFSNNFIADCYRVLKNGGILVQQTESPFYHFKSIIQKNRNNVISAGFSDTHSFCFPQPCYPSGWWSATLSSKNKVIADFREKDALEKNFLTHYYNAGIHRSALALPEFMKR